MGRQWCSTWNNFFVSRFFAQIKFRLGSGLKDIKWGCVGGLEGGHYASFRTVSPAYAGKTVADVKSWGDGGNTPAYAGKTSDALLSSAFGEKHPRIDGEDFHINMFKLSAWPLTSITASGDYVKYKWRFGSAVIQNCLLWEFYYKLIVFHQGRVICSWF